MNLSTEDIDHSLVDEQSCVDVDKFNSVHELVIKGKKALKSGGGMLALKKKLVNEINIFSEKHDAPPELDLDNEYQSIILDNWIEELLRFLALKTITGDYTEPCQLLPGHGVNVGWKVLIKIPSLYSKVCLSMGNQTVFDHNPSDTVQYRVKKTHKIKRFNATLRAYESYFDEQPQVLYWSYHPKEKEHYVLGFLNQLCGCDTSVISYPFALNDDLGMSPAQIVE